jgi:hypothetical protein
VSQPGIRGHKLNAGHFVLKRLLLAFCLATTVSSPPRISYFLTKRRTPCTQKTSVATPHWKTSRVHHAHQHVIAIPRDTHLYTRTTLRTMSHCPINTHLVASHMIPAYFPMIQQPMRPMIPPCDRSLDTKNFGFTTVPSS